MVKNKSNGYYKYYDKYGKCCRIKINGVINNERVILHISHPADEKGFLHIPNKVFRNGYHVVNYMCKHLETNGLIVSVSTPNAR